MGDGEQIRRRSGAFQSTGGTVPEVHPFARACDRNRLWRLALGAVLLGGALTGCATKHSNAPTATTTAAHAARPAVRSRPGIGLRLVGSARLPAPVQLPGLARTADGRVVAVGGLDLGDSSTADVIGVLPAPARRIGRLPLAAHDIGVTAIGDVVLAFGGGTASGPVATITALDRNGHSRIVGRLPVAMSDTTAVTIGRTAYVVGGYTTTVALRSVIAFRPGHHVRVAAELPYPVRYAAAAAIGSHVYVAGGTTGTQARREIVEVDPATHHTRIVGRLPEPLAHAAGVSLDGIFYVLGGRGDALTAQHATIWAFDPTTRRLRRAGRLARAVSDLAAVRDGSHIVVVGGRDARGEVLAERWTFRRR